MNFQLKLISNLTQTLSQKFTDLNTLEWQDLNIKFDAQYVQFQVVGPGENILMIMEIQNESNSPRLNAIHRLKIGYFCKLSKTLNYFVFRSLESLQQLCFYTLLKHMPKLRTMSEEERRQNGIIYFV